jgi:hypothetical protein
MLMRSSLEGVLSLARRSCFQRMAIALMMAAAVAFALQCMFVAVSEAATGDSSHYYLGFVFSHPHGGAHGHVVRHRHADGTIHQHAIDDDDDAIAKHVKKPGLDMALVVCVLPCRNISTISDVPGRQLTIENPSHLWVVDLRGLRRPPRPASIT